MSQFDESQQPMEHSRDAKDEMAELIECYIIENRELFDQLGQDLLELENHPLDTELHKKVFRAVHTVKGTSSFLGFDQMTELTHVFEDVLNRLRKGEIIVTANLMDIMLEAFDIMKILLERIEAKNKEPVDLSSILEKLNTITNSIRLPDTNQALPPAPLGQPGTAAAKPRESASTRGTPSQSADSFIRVDVGRLNGLMDLVGELVLGRNRFSQIAQQVNEQYEDFPFTKQITETCSQIDFITTELQMAIMRTRMVPIEKLLNKFPRLIRDLSREMSKEIELQVYGEDTELDKSIIDELNDPLIHILRNAADHGIELPEQRVRAGKPSKGTVMIRAEQEGNQIVISIEDDGRGIDLEKLKEAAIRKGLINEEQVKEMAQHDILNLIFVPGFSTAEKVTNVSGRGVGLDVVRTNIGRLKGIIDIDSEKNVGTKIVLKLPLTLAIIQGLLVKTGNEIFAIPLGSVLEVLRVQANEISTIKGREVIRLRNLVLPLAHISEALGGSANGSPTEYMYIVVVGVADQRMGIIVDSLLGQKELVIKSLGQYLTETPGVAGSTILGDGRVIMILDVGQFMRLCAEKPRR